jgi:hypothetical protein
VLRVIFVVSSCKSSTAKIAFKSFGECMASREVFCREPRGESVTNIVTLLDRFAQLNLDRIQAQPLPCVMVQNSSDVCIESKYLRTSFELVDAIVDLFVCFLSKRAATVYL